jgi:integrase
MSIRKRVLPSKKIAWLVDYRDADGKRRHKQFPTRRQADEWSVETRADVASKRHVPGSSSATVKEAGESWIKRCELLKLEASTIKSYREHLDLHIYPYAGHRILTDLGTADVTRWYERLLEEGRTPDMVRRVRMNLAAVISHAQAKEWVVRNVVELVPFETSDRSKEPVEIPLISEVQRLIRAATAEWALAFLYLLVFAGLRMSEIRGLAWRNIDWSGGAINVDQRADYRNVLGRTKSVAGRRRIPVPQIVLQALRVWKLMCPCSDLDLVFPTKKGTAHSYANLRNRFWIPLQLVAGLIFEKDGGAEGKYGLHALRHFCASLWIEAGTEPKTVQTWIGHASIMTTFDRYGHLFEDRERDRSITDRVQKRVFGA